MDVIRPCFFLWFESIFHCHRGCMTVTPSAWNVISKNQLNQFKFNVRFYTCFGDFYKVFVLWLHNRVRHIIPSLWSVKADESLKPNTLFNIYSYVINYTCIRFNGQCGFVSNLAVRYSVRRQIGTIRVVSCGITQFVSQSVRKYGTGNDFRQ